MKKHVILLRGVMPTGRNKVPMALLRTALEKAGLANVRTYIQSGNVLADTDLGRRDVEKLVHDTIASSFGGDIAVVARTPAQFRAILEKNPFAEADTSRQYFTLLADRPPAQLVSKFAAIDFAPDEVKVVGDVVHSLYATKLSVSKFNNNWVERTLKVAATTRNFNTMSRLAEMAAE